jgi:hypothetical protein
MVESAQWVSPAVQVLFRGVAASALVEAAQVLGSDPGQGDLLVDVAEFEADQQPLPGVLGQPVGAAAQQPPDAEQRVVFAAAVSGGFLLDAAAHVVDGGEAEPADVEGVEHPDRGRQRGG